jgi:hypothetical protein
MVFEETAGATLELAHLDMCIFCSQKLHESALVPKVPAQSDVSPPNAQTHRLPDQIVSANLSRA